MDEYQDKPKGRPRILTDEQERELCRLYYIDKKTPAELMVTFPEVKSPKTIQSIASRVRKEITK